MVRRIAPASPASTGDSTTVRIVAPTRSTARLSTPESWRSRPEVAERGDRRPRIVAREHRARLASPQVLRRELARPQLPATRHLHRDPDVLSEIDPREVLTEGRQRRDLLPGEIVVGDAGQIEVPIGGEGRPDGEPRVHLQELELAVARVLRELDMGDPRVADGAEQPQSELEHPRLVVDLEHGARSEAKRPLPDFPPHERDDRLARAADG